MMAGNRGHPLRFLRRDFFGRGAGMLAVVCVLALAPLSVHAAETVLQSGVPFNTSLSGKTIANASISVPAGATKLTVTLTNGSGDLDLYVKYGSPVQGTTVAQFDADTDFLSDGPTADETIVVTPASNPPLQAGTWYVATLSWNSSGTDFTITATVEAPVTETNHELNISVHPAVNIPGTAFSSIYSIKKGSVVGNVDLYAAVGLPDGTILFFGASGLSASVVPLQRDFIVADLTGTLVPEFALPGKLPLGQYAFYGLLVKTGKDPLDSNNWASNLGFGTMHFSVLSPAQEAFVRELGYPQQFVKVFSTHEGKKRVDETWGYLAEGLGENFINGVFVHEEAFANRMESAPPGRFRPEHYSFDTTLDDVIARHGQPLDTKKDMIGDGYFKTYFYDGIVFGFLNGGIVSAIAGK